MSYRNPDSRRVWGVFAQDEKGDWHADFYSTDSGVSDLEEACRAAGRGFVLIYLPDHAKIEPFRWAGSVSEGTLLVEDLVPKYIEVLDDLNKGQVEYLASTSPEWGEYVALVRNGQAVGLRDCDQESVGEFMERLYDELNDAAPEGYVFGAHEGDGASFGFWRTEDGIGADDGDFDGTLFLDPGKDPEPVKYRCYSDHNEDVRTKGSCDLCHGTETQ